ncbi:MAG: dTMP kinase [Candidatus Bathyarchaeota archaeon]|nr:MAG: dTMP kinase [Candidatus Bathyarchaeota archaeon]
MNKKGTFICIEGLDGSGKTTQAKLLTQKLRKSHKAVYTAEPSQGKIGTFIRRSYLYGEQRLSSIIEALLFAADRIEHVEAEVLPALNQEKLVISDRYLYSSLAYQGAAGLSLEWIEKINEHALRPDLAILIDVDPKTAIHRLKPNKSVMENMETQQKVRKIYLKFVEKGSLTRINGDQPKNEVSQELYAVVMKFLNASR